MSDEEPDEFSREMPSRRLRRTDPTLNGSRERVSFSALTHSLHGSMSRRNMSGHSTARQSQARFSFLSHGSQSSNSSSTSSRRFGGRTHRPSRRTSHRPSAALGAATLARTILGRTSTPPTPSNQNSSFDGTTYAANAARNADSRRTNYRRYRVGESCLVECQLSKLANLVNRYGFPAGQGYTPEEQRGPYMYVLATVKKVHFDEDAEYYTVTRADTEAEQRADAGKCR